jgi:hypothetical protein
MAKLLSDLPRRERERRVSPTLTQEANNMANPTNLTCAQAAQAYLEAKTAPAKAKLAKFIAAKAETSSRVRWERLHNAIEDGDTARIEYRAATDAAGRKAALAKFDDAPAKPKASKPKAKAKAKPAKQAEAGAMDALASALDGLDADALAAFLTAYVAKRNA